MEIILKNYHHLHPFLKFKWKKKSCISLEEKLDAWVTFLNRKEKLLQLYKWPCEHYLSQPAKQEGIINVKKPMPCSHCYMPNSNRTQLSPPRLSPKMYRVADSEDDNAWQ